MDNEIDNQIAEINRTWKDLQHISIPPQETLDPIEVPTKRPPKKRWFTHFLCCKKKGKKGTCTEASIHHTLVSVL